MNKSAKEYLFTSESVSEVHPDKVADQISDAILDAILEQDPTARVAAETLCTTGTVMLAGEISTTANVDYTKIVRDTLKRIGYDDSSYGIDHKGCAVLVAYDKQSPDIAQGVDKAQDDPLEKGADMYIASATTRTGYVARGIAGKDAASSVESHQTAAREILRGVYF